MWGGVAFAGSLGAQKYAGISVRKSSTAWLKHGIEVHLVSDSTILKTTRPMLNFRMSFKMSNSVIDIIQHIIFIFT